MIDKRRGRNDDPLDRCIACPIGRRYATLTEEEEKEKVA